MLKLSVIVPTHNREIMLRDCVMSLIRQDYDDSEYEIIVIDDGSIDGTKEMILRLIRQGNNNLRYVWQSHAGVSTACNKGIIQARARTLAFTEDDCIFPSDWIRKHISCHMLHPDIVAVQGKIISTSNKNLMVKIEQEIHDAYYAHLFCKNNDNKYTNILSSGNSSFKSEIFFRDGLLFKDSLLSCEDLDLGIQIITKGHRINYFDDIVVFHRHRDTLSSFVKKNFRDGRGRYIFNCMWHNYKQIFEERSNFSLRFFMKMCGYYLFQYRLTGIILILLHIIRKISHVMGFYYQKSVDWRP